MKGKITSVILAVLLITINAHGLKKISEYDNKASPSDGDYILFELANNSDFNHATIAQLKANTFQPLDSDLTILAGLTFSANMQTFLEAANYAAIRTLLGLVIGTNVQAYDADLTTYAGITPSANIQSLLAAANYAAMRTLLDLEPGTDFYSISAADSAFEGTLANEAGLYSALSDVDIFYEPGDTLQTNSSTSLPGTCTVGETYIDTNADTDGTLYICVATDTWKDVDDDGGPGGINDIVDDVSPQLGGNLDIQAFNIEGVDATEFGYLDGVTGDIQTGKQEDLDVPSQAEAEAGVATDERVWTAQRVGQAIAALAGGGNFPCAVLDDLVAADDNQSLGSRPVAITLIKVWCFYRGTGTTAAQISFEDAGGTAMTTSAALECVAHSATPSEGSGMETFTGGNTLIAYEGLFMDVDNTPAPTTDDYTICWEYTID